MLRSPFMNTPWCATAMHTECSRHGAHTPHPECREGIYLFTSGEDAVTMATTRTPLMDLVTTFGFKLTYVVGELSTPGPVSEHFNFDFAFGGQPEWIAQEVRIEALYLLPNLCSVSTEALARELTDRYAVPVKMLAFDDDLDVIISRLRTNARIRIGAIPQSNVDVLSPERV